MDVKASEPVSVFDPDGHKWMAWVEEDKSQALGSAATELMDAEKSGAGLNEILRERGEARTTWLIGEVDDLDSDFDIGFLKNLALKRLQSRNQEARLISHAANAVGNCCISSGDIEGALRMSFLYDSYLNRNILSKLYAVTGNIQAAANLMIKTDSNEFEKKNARDCINYFFYAINGDSNLANDLATFLLNSNMSPNALSVIHIWLNIFKLYGLSDIYANRIREQVTMRAKPLFNQEQTLRFTPYFEFSDKEITGKPLLIVFTGFNIPDAVDKHYEKYGIENLEALYGTFGVPGLKFFANKNKFNVLLIKDELQVWGLMHFWKVYDLIREYISYLKPSKIITTGGSAGGFQSLLFGITLNVNMAIASSPQAIAFHDFMNDYRISMNESYWFSLENICYIPKLMKLNEYDTKIVMLCSSGYKPDLWYCNLIKNTDSRAILKQYDAGNEHNIVDTLGYDFIYKEYMELIDSELNVR